MRRIARLLLLAGVIFGYGHGFASLAGHVAGGWESHGCPHGRSVEAP